MCIYVESHSACFLKRSEPLVDHMLVKSRVRKTFKYRAFRSHVNALIDKLVFEYGSEVIKSLMSPDPYLCRPQLLGRVGKVCLVTQTSQDATSSVLSNKSKLS